MSGAQGYFHASGAPLLLGTIGSVLGFFTLPSLFVLLLGSGRGADCWGCVPPLSADLFVLAWAVSPFLGLAGAFNVKKRGKVGGLLFVTAGTLPWIGASFFAFFWTPPLVLAGILAILNWPGKYVDKEEESEIPEANSTSD